MTPRFATRHTPPLSRNEALRASRASRFRGSIRKGCVCSFYGKRPSASVRCQSQVVLIDIQVGNVAKWSPKQWKSDIALVQSAHIDAFALDIAAGEPHTSASLNLAFRAAASLGFKLFFSFDYAGNESFDQSDVISYTNKYAASPAYYRHN